MEHADFNLKALYEALDEQRQVREMSWAAVAREINGLSMGVPLSNTQGQSIKPVALPLKAGDPPIKTTEHAMAASTIIGIKNKAHVEGDGVLQMLRWLRRSPESFIPGFDNGDAERFRLPELEKEQVLRWDTRALYAALDTQRQARGMTWKELAQEVGGFSPAMLMHLAKGGRTGFPRVMRLVRWLDQPAAAFTRVSDW